ncbi:MAG: hypothetical protein HLUCCO16_07925 [Phormidium sp. OSCR]|nr:MAG: hypothetical protein HLUCCO16_07925 [Phormidium sp. OSCR]
METPPGAGTGGFCLRIKGVGVEGGDRTHRGEDGSDRVPNGRRLGRAIAQARF